MADRYDVIVVGLGAMGSASAYHLARRGLRVLGLDRWPVPHAHGSSHGDSRIIREMYFEHPLYVPLVQRAYELWRELEREAGTPLMRIHGGLMIGPREGTLITGTLRSAEEHHLPYELLSPPQVRARFPAFGIAADLVAVFDPRAGYLDPEACTAAHLSLAARHGADLRYGEPVLGWAEDGDGVRVRTASEEWAADRLLLTAGAWTRALLGDLDLPLVVERQVPFWFDLPGDGDYEPERCPIYAWEHTPGFIGYGFPRLEKGVKAALMHQGETAAHPDAIRRAIDPGEAEPLRSALRRILPAAGAAPMRDATTCLFTNTPDGDFAIGFHPAHPRVLVSSPCSGHGFKFASAIGELHAGLLIDGRTRFDLAPFRLDRFEL